MDFRSNRVKLPADAFAIAPDVEPEPQDPIDEGTWSSIVSLPDDVSMRTSDDFGTESQLLWSLWGIWIELALDVQNHVKNPPDSPMSSMVLDCTDHFQSSFYNAFVGFYRESISGIRNVLESLTIGSYLELTNNTLEFKNWLKGDIEIPFGKAGSKLIRQLKPFEKQIRKIVQADLFSQKYKTKPGGLLRRLYKEICPYTHGAPGHTNGDIWQSNGPIYRPNYFIKFNILFLKAFIIGFILTSLTFPNLTTIKQEKYKKSLIIAMSKIPKEDQDKVLLLECLKIQFP